MGEWNIAELSDLIRQLRQGTETLIEKGRGIPAVEVNGACLLTDIGMLELNISDLKEMD